MTDTYLSIGQLAEQVGLPPKTLRFYESEGVIAAAQRSENGYRRYSAVLIDEIKLIKQARDLGIPLKEIKKLIKGCEGQSCEHNRNYVQTQIQEYLQLLEKQIAQFTVLQQRLQHLQTTLTDQDTACSSGKYCCNILHQLTEQVEGGE